MMSTRVKQFLLVTATAGTLLLTYWQSHVTKPVMLPFEVSSSWFPPQRLPVTSHSGSSVRHACTDVITNMLQGHWEENKDVKESDKLDMYHYYDEVLKTRGVEYGLQRPDGRCGNVYNGWYRALCHPGGPTPCCYHSRCVNASLANCTCPRCFDLRAQIEADLATWRADDETCQPRQMAPAEVCSLLGNATLYFIGDSLVRHLYMAFAMLVTGKEDEVFHHPNMTAELKRVCRGRYLFSNIRCRPVVLHSPQLCGGAVRSKFAELRGVKLRRQIVSEILSLANLSRSLVVFGIGVDDRYNATAIQDQIWDPLLQRMRTGHLTSPHLVWTTPHVIGPIKAVARDYRTEFKQDFQHVQLYTQRMAAFLKERGVAVLSSFNITLGVLSHDGIHHGLGVNRLRAQVLLHHVHELSQRGLWK